MPAKKPAIKQSKPKKAAPAKAVARKPEAHRPAVASRKAVAASSAKPAPKAAASSARPERSGTRGGGSAATPPATPAAGHGHGHGHGPASETRQAAPVHAPRVVAMPDADDGEGGDASSLLAGPRNVKPYVARRGEQYMGKQQLSHFQQILLNWKRDLMEEVDRTVSHMKDEAANFPDPNDRATQEEEFSLELRTRDRERKLIRKIEEALKRIEDGTYGYCLETGEEIGIKRLEARPVATLSIEAQERRERRERQYGDRDDRYR
jgi:DnaK suppressor protein